MYNLTRSRCIDSRARERPKGEVVSIEVHLVVVRILDARWLARGWGQDCL